MKYFILKGLAPDHSRISQKVLQNFLISLEMWQSGCCVKPKKLVLLKTFSLDTSRELPPSVCLFFFFPVPPPLARSLTPRSRREERDRGGSALRLEAKGGAENRDGEGEG